MRAGLSRRAPAQAWTEVESVVCRSRFVVSAAVRAVVPAEPLRGRPQSCTTKKEVDRCCPKLGRVSALGGTCRQLSDRMRGHWGGQTWVGSESIQRRAGPDVRGSIHGRCRGPVSIEGRWVDLRSSWARSWVERVRRRVGAGRRRADLGPILGRSRVVPVSIRCRSTADAASIRWRSRVDRGLILGRSMGLFGPRCPPLRDRPAARTPPGRGRPNRLLGGVSLLRRHLLRYHVDESALVRPPRSDSSALPAIPRATSLPTLPNHYSFVALLVCSTATLRR